MARIVSLVVLVVILLAIAVLFFKVMADFLLPMFLAVLLVVMFGPLHRWFVARCKGHDRLAAGLTSLAIVLIFMVPLMLILVQAAYEGHVIYAALLESVRQGDAPEEAKNSHPQPGTPDAAAIQQAAAAAVVDWGGRLGLRFNQKEVEKGIRAKAQEWLTPLALSTTQYLGSLLVGLAVMIISLYYFLADGPAMIRAAMRISPLDHRYEERLLDQFVNLARSVVIATVAAAVVQGLLAGIGFYFSGVGSAFLLMVLTMLAAMIPFVGSTIVWVPICLWLFFYQQRTVAAVALAVYCTVIVSTVDNVVKPMILHGRSNLHPLLALLSVLGGVQALGPIGIFVGPMVVVFLYVLLEMLHTELGAMSAGPQRD